MSGTVLITGASTGIGRVTAELFAANGWNVAATMRTPAKATPFDANGGRIELLRLDVNDAASIEAARDAAIGKFGYIDVVVNNAGYGLVGPFEAMTPEQIERQLATNVTGVMNVCRAMLPHFRARRAGTIINVASMGGRITFPYYSVYHATKWAVEGFTESLAYELRPLGIRVKIIEPGPIKTDFYERSMDIARKDGLTDYDATFDKVMPNMQKAGATAPGPGIVAHSIWSAATDGSERLRYKPNSAGILTLRRLLPDRVFQRVVRGAVGL